MQHPDSMPALHRRLLTPVLVMALLTAASPSCFCLLQELGLDAEIVAMACQAAEILMIMRQVSSAVKQLVACLLAASKRLR